MGLLSFMNRSPKPETLKPKPEMIMKPKPELILCQLCFDPKPKDESFSIKPCSHSHCKDCISIYIASKLKQNLSPIPCPVPNCSSLLEPYDCRSILPVEVFDRWANALYEALILGSQKFCCPYEDCSVMLIDDGGEIVRESECPNCRRLFCAQCNVPWHGDIQCVEFQKLNNDEISEKEDRMVMEVAEEKQQLSVGICQKVLQSFQNLKPFGNHNTSPISPKLQIKPKPEFLCEICFDPKSEDESFSIKGCSHSYCKDCMANYVRSKLQVNISQISCPVPNCSGSLEFHDCRSILPLEVFDKWDNALCQALILESQKFYCPYKDCSSMLIDDGGKVVKESECPNCRRLFCAQCKVPWHGEIQCAEFEKLHKDEREKEDIMLLKLAENKHWRRCPKCRMFVERTQGCRYMKCRCGASFCYGCGSAKISTLYHYCNFCKR